MITHQYKSASKDEEFTVESKGIDSNYVIFVTCLLYHTHLIYLIESGFLYLLNFLTCNIFLIKMLDVKSLTPFVIDWITVMQFATS